MTTNIRFEDWEAEQMRDPEFREAAEALEPAYQVARLRMLRGLTQKELARAVGTRQPSIARLESGKSEPRLSFLRKVATALEARLEIQLVPHEKEVEPITEEQGIPVYNWPGHERYDLLDDRAERASEIPSEEGVIV